MILPIVIFCLFIVVHALIFGLCASAAHGDREMERWVRRWRNGE